MLFNGNLSFGFGYHGSKEAANIVYNMDRFYVTDAGLTTIDNAGSDGSTSDAPMYASNHIYLDGSTQSVDYPIPHTLGSELIINPWVEYLNNTLVDNLDGSFTCTMVDSDRMCQSTGLIYEVGKTYAIQKTITTDTASGNMILWDGLTAHVLSANSTTEYIVATGTGGDIRFNNFSVGEFATFEIELQEITNPNSDITYFDTATKSHIRVDNSVGTPSITYNQTDSHSNTFTLTKARTVEEIASDKLYLDAHPESVARLVDVPELVTNSTLDVDILNWNTGHNTPTLSHNVDSISAVDGVNSYWSFSSELDGFLTVGTKYLIDIDIKEVNLTTDNSFTIVASSTIAGTTGDTEDISVDLPNQTNTVIRVEFTPTRADLQYITFWSVAGGAGTIDISNLSVKEVISTNLTFDIADLASFYPANEGEASGAYVQDVMVDLGSELINPALTSADFSVLGGVMSQNGDISTFTATGGGDRLMETYWTVLIIIGIVLAAGCVIKAVKTLTTRRRNHESNY